MSRYVSALTDAMTLLGNEDRSIFIGQSVGVDGTSMYKTLIGVPLEKRVEFPVAEELQMGVSIGLALEGFLPVSIFPRCNFLLLAVNQLVNHLDRLPLYSGYKPTVIVRTAVGRDTPLDPGWQHKDDCSLALAMMCHTINVVSLSETNVVHSYMEAMTSNCSTILVEQGNLC